MEIKYDIPFEVTQKQYNAAMNRCAGIVTGRQDENGKYWLKVWMMKDVEYVKQVLKETL